MNENYSPGQIIRFRRRMNAQTSEFFDKSWIYGFCLGINDCQSMHFLGIFHGHGIFDTLNLRYDLVERVNSPTEIPDANLRNVKNVQTMAFKPWRS
ncbi:MAG: hypothetical protein AABX11_00165 [Nanoarchaeota archaeon]